MKIAIVYDVLYPFHVGGAERRFWELARRLAARGHDVSLLGMKLWEGPDTMVREGVRYVGVSRAVAPFTRSGARSPREPVVFARGVRRHLTRERYEILDCGEVPYLPALAALRATRGGARVVVTWHEARGARGWLRYQGAMGLIAAVFERRLAARSRHNVAISEDTARRCRAVLGMAPPAVVSCGVDVAAAEAADGERRPQILHVGRLVEHKQVDWALRVFAGWVAAHPEYRLVIVGTGPAEPNLRSLAERLGVSRRVAFLGAVDENRLRREYRQSRLLLFPSRQEGFGMVVIEAMAAGTPVIALDTPSSAARTLIRHRENGWLAAGVDEMQRAVEEILADESLWKRMSGKARQSAEAYDWDRAVVPALESVYRRVISARG